MIRDKGADNTGQFLELTEEMVKRGRTDRRHIPAYFAYKSKQDEIN